MRRSTILGASRASGASAAQGIHPGIAAITGFWLLFTLAIRNMDRDIHPRLIVFAMLPLLPSGIHRLYMVPLGLTTFPVVAMHATLDAMPLAIIVHERHREGAIGKYAWIGAGWIVLHQAVDGAIVDTEPFAGVVRWLGALAHYR